MRCWMWAEQRWGPEGLWEVGPGEHLEALPQRGLPSSRLPGGAVLHWLCRPVVRFSGRWRCLRLRGSGEPELRLCSEEVSPSTGRWPQKVIPEGGNSMSYGTEAKWVEETKSLKDVSGKTQWV